MGPKSNETHLFPVYLRHSLRVILGSIFSALVFCTWGQMKFSTCGIILALKVLWISEHFDSRVYGLGVLNPYLPLTSPVGDRALKAGVEDPGISHALVQEIECAVVLPCRSKNNRSRSLLSH
ncbi:Hypothetical predicted protein [Marmota monax]|uniref:Uncharacterized protein n=1 Tax=Marmota monax TaxID=9995 RepID=A0A5E4ASA4_MARMO|nr:hypothetical protein GHT09_013290 [Marmota monax]VTJ59790.1 Hypothetical predicted protein [Marmota monax]